MSCEHLSSSNICKPSFLLKEIIQSGIAYKVAFCSYGIIFIGRTVTHPTVTQTSVKTFFFFCFSLLWLHHPHTQERTRSLTIALFLLIAQKNMQHTHMSVLLNTDVLTLSAAREYTIPEALLR
jgi:hypothetical protein